jgi:hypothetical protein
MRNMTKMFALGALGAGALGAAVLAKRWRAAKLAAIDDFDFSDLAEPVVVTEEVVVVTEPPPFVVDVELVPIEEQKQR